jgi:hypothetical protein
MLTSMLSIAVVVVGRTLCHGFVFCCQPYVGACDVVEAAWPRECHCTDMVVPDCATMRLQTPCNDLNMIKYH